MPMQHVALKVFQQFMVRSRDGYAIFDNEDRLVYCNATYADLNGSTPKSHSDIGLATISRLRPGTEFGERKESKACTTDYRISEVGLLDGRWFMSSEHRLDDGWLIHRLVDITQQKQSELNLESTVQELRKLSVTDELTRVLNRRGFVAEVEIKLTLGSRTGTTMSMGLLDLDHFKSVNDRYGHSIGDLALKHAAQIISHTIRESDSVGRIGGEEFAIFLGNTSIKTAIEVLNRIRIELESTPLKLPSGELYITASIGLSSISRQTSFERLFSEADMALYTAKENGRNRVELSSDRAMTIA